MSVAMLMLMGMESSLVIGVLLFVALLVTLFVVNRLEREMRRLETRPNSEQPVASDEETR